jgi:zinc protease
MLFIDTSYNTFYGGNPQAHLIFNPSDYDKMNLGTAHDIYMERIGNAYGMYYVFTGSFTEEQIKPLIEKYIGGLPSQELAIAHGDLGLEPLKGKKEFTFLKGSEAQGMLMYYITGEMPYDENNNFLLSQLNEIINNKVTDGIREKMGAIYGGGISGSQRKYPDEDYLLRAAFPCGPENISGIDAAFMDILQKVQEDGEITEADLRKVTEPALEHNKVNIKDNRYWLNYFINAYLNGNDPEGILVRDQKIKAITVKDMTETARKYYSGPNLFKAQWLPEVVN